MRWRAVGGVVGVVMTAFGKREINRQEAKRSQEARAKRRRAKQQIPTLGFFPSFLVLVERSYV